MPAFKASLILIVLFSFLFPSPFTTLTFYTSNFKRAHVFKIVNCQRELSPTAGRPRGNLPSYFYDFFATVVLDSTRKRNTDLHLLLKSFLISMIFKSFRCCRKSFHTLLDPDHQLVSMPSSLLSSTSTSTRDVVNDADDDAKISNEETASVLTLAGLIISVQIYILNYLGQTQEMNI